jgi:hypothetical protein
VVDSSWSGLALKEYLATAPTVRVQHNPQRDPAGSGVRVDVNRDGDGAHWLKAAVDEPVAQRLVRKGHLRAFSVGIARPVIERDISGKARGGVIKGGKIVEVSLVDSPANRSCFLELAKSDKTGACEFTGKVGGSDEVLAKALDGDTLTKDGGGHRTAMADAFAAAVNPDDMSISFTPTDLFKILKTKVVTEHYDDLARKAVSEKEHGVQNPLDQGDGASKSDGVTADGIPDGAATAPGTIGEPAQPQAVKAKGKKPGKGKKMPPWLKPDSGSDDEKGSDGDDGACKTVHEHTDKCHTSPAEAAGVTASPMDPAPAGELMESTLPAALKGSPTPASGTDGESMTPVPQHREPDGAIVEPFEHDAKLPSTGQGEKPTRLEAPMMSASKEVSALLRFKTIGIDPDLGRLHDLTCPAYHPDEVAKYHPFAELSTLIEDGVWQRKALEAACGPLEHAMKMQEIWGAALTLKGADAGELNDYRLELHKAFRDANPGPGTYPTPGSVSPQKYTRPLIDAGHSATSTGHDGPNTSPQVATMAPSAQNFDRPPLSAGQQSPSPSFMKGDGEYPQMQGVPTQLSYAHMDKDRARMALSQMHEHLGRQFPEVCPMDLDRTPVQPEARPVPAPAGIGKAIDPGPAPVPPVAAALKADPEDEGMFADADVYKSFKKQRKRLGKKVLAGKMTVDEARAKMGRRFAQKAADDLTAAGVEQVRKGVKSIDETRERLSPPDLGGGAALVPAIPKDPAPAAPAVAAAFDPEVIKAAVAEATTELKDLLVKQQETFTSKLAETQRVIDAIADQPDPSTAAFSGLAFNPVRKAARPAGVVDQAEHAERVQQMTIRTLQDLYNSSSDPHEREAYYATLTKMRGA